MDGTSPFDHPLPHGGLSSTRIGQMLRRCDRIDRHPDEWVPVVNELAADVRLLLDVCDGLMIECDRLRIERDALRGIRSVDD